MSCVSHCYSEDNGSFATNVRGFVLPIYNFHICLFYSHMFISLSMYISLSRDDFKIFLIFDPYRITMSSSPVLRFVKLTEKAIPPTRGSARAAGLDLYSACNTTVPARGKVSVPTNIQIRVPVGCYGRIAPRSGLALHHNIDVGAE